MVGAIQGAGVLVLLSAFFAYLLAPAVVAVRRRVRIGRRKRPVSDAVALALIYAGVFLPAAVAWHRFNDRVTYWVQVTAPQAVDQLFSGSDFKAFELALAWPQAKTASKAENFLNRTDIGFRRCLAGR